MRSDPKPLFGQRILVVEDEYFIADDLTRTLEGLGANIVGPASTVAQATRLLAEQPVDCVVLDINLEGEMAFPLAQELAGRDVPVVVASGYDPAVYGSKIKAVAAIEKPCSAERLGEVLTETLAARAQLPR